MKKHSRAAALGIALLIALLAALSLWPLWLQKRPIIVPSTAVPWAIVGEGTPGVEANYQSYLEWDDIPCNPDEWRNIITFELRTSDGEVIDVQKADTSCQVICGFVTPPPDERCGWIVAPVWRGIVPPGVYQIWFRGEWVNERYEERRLSHPPSFTDLDERGFRWLVEYSRSGIYLPIVEKDHAD